METLFSKRIKNLVFVVLLVILILVALYLKFIKKVQFPESKIEQTIVAKINNIENNMRERIGSLKHRSGYLLDKYVNKNLDHGELNKREALVFVEMGKMINYVGEIYYYKSKQLDIGEWALLKKNVDLYFIQKLDSDIFYLTHFIRFDKNFILNLLDYSFFVTDLKFIDQQINSKADYLLGGKLKDGKYFSHLFSNSNNQLLVHIEFLPAVQVNYHKKNQMMSFYIMLSLILLLIVLKAWHSKGTLYRVLFLIAITALFISVILIIGFMDKGDIYLNLGGIWFDSIYKILVLVVYLLIVASHIQKRVKPVFLSYLLYNLSVVFTLGFAHKILETISFYYSEFNSNHEYITLLLIIFLLYLIPVMFLKRIKLDNKTKNLSLCLAGQSVIIIICVIFLQVQLLPMLTFSLIIFLLLFSQKKFLLRLLILFLLSVSIFFQITDKTDKTRRDFITNNLKKIYLNQGNYAQFIAKEIVYEINSYLKLNRTNLKEFFKPGLNGELEEIWKNSLASLENVTSGIFVISRGDEIISSFTHHMPFVEVKDSSHFPIWSLEKTTGTLYGKEVSLATASIQIAENYDLLGEIIIQVLNLPEFVLISDDRSAIFSLDKTIKGLELSYIKKDGQNRIVENPANIDIDDLPGVVDIKDDEWLGFKSQGLYFKGYSFRSGQNIYLIFFPKNTLWKDIAEIIKIFLLLFLFFGIFYFKEIRELEWKSLYYSFSFRVFLILILISFLTALLFSIFSLNYNYRSAETQLMESQLKKGEIALNMIENIIGDQGELNQNHLFLMSNMIDNDITAYQQGALLFTSNYEKIIDSEIPVYLSSDTLDFLKYRNQKIELDKNKNQFNLYFKVHDYVINIEFYPRDKYSFLRKETFSDIIIVLFFMLLMSGFFSAFFFRNKILAPINDLNRSMIEVGKGNLKTLDKIPSEFELKNLYIRFNAMVKGVAEQKKNISEISRMKILVDLSRRVAHEVKNPLTPIRLSAQQIEEALKDKRKDYEEIIKKSVSFIIDETEHLKKVAYGFLDLSKLDKIERTRVNLNKLVHNEIKNMINLYPNVKFKFQGGKGNFPVFVDVIKIRQAVVNLLNNSIDAIGEKPGQIEILVQELNGKIVIEVKDNGIGMDKQELDKVFRGNYSSKEIGTGLGFFIVKRIVELHRGTIEIKSKKNVGTSIIIEFPAEFVQNINNQ